MVSEEVIQADKNTERVLLPGSSRIAFFRLANTIDQVRSVESHMITQTAGRNALGTFAPEFAHFNDDVLFGENWNNQDIDLKTRCIMTVVALMASGVTDSSLIYHLENAKKHGVSRKEIAAVVTHVAFYAGWPKAWAVFNMAKEIWNDEENEASASAAKTALPNGWNR